MSLSGSNLYEEIVPIVENGTSYGYDGVRFLNDIAAKISAYVVTNDLVEGVYVGYIPTTPPTPSTLVAVVANFVPVHASFAPVVPYDYKTWIKNTFNFNFANLLNITWNLVSVTHILPIDPIQGLPVIPFQPLSSTLEVLGGLEDIRTAEGFWALICDAIVWSVLSSITRLPISTVSAKGADGSSGTITWIPTDIPDFKHNFVFRIFYNATNEALVAWLIEHGVDVTHLSGEVDVPMNNLMYQEALTLWKGLRSTTLDCKFYKKQDNGRLILLMVGTQK